MNQKLTRQNSKTEINSFWLLIFSIFFASMSSKFGELIFAHVWKCLIFFNMRLVQLSVRP